jgi:hypothetical protein
MPAERSSALTIGRACRREGKHSVNAKKKHRPPAIAVLLLVLAAACTNPVSIERHARVDSVVLLHDDEVLAEAERTTFDGAIALEVGELLGPITVEFRQRGTPVTPAGDFFLEIIFVDAGIAAFDAPQAGDFTGTLRGVAAGSTAMRVRLMHGRPGSVRAHPDFESAAIPVGVSGGG